MHAVIYLIKQNKNEQRISIYYIISTLHIYDSLKKDLKKNNSIKSIYYTYYTE